MNDSNYRNRRTALLWAVGNHQCLHCGHIGSPKNRLEFHHCNMNAKRSGCGGRQQLVRLEQEWWEWIRFKTPQHALIVLCHDCHMRVHSHQEEEEAKEDDTLFQELTRYRFCANQGNYCIYKKCIDCPDYRNVTDPEVKR